MVVDGPDRTERASTLLPSEIQALFGLELLQELEALLNEAIHNEVQDLLYAGWSEEEQLSYLEASPQFPKNRKALLDLEAKMTAKILPAFKKAMKAYVKAIHDREASPKEKTEKGKKFTGFFAQVAQLRTFLDDEKPIQKTRALELISGIIQRLAFEVDTHLKKWQISPAPAQFIIDLLGRVLTQLSGQTGINCVQRTLVSFAERDAIAFRTHSLRLNQLVVGERGETAHEVELLSEIDELMLKRKRSFTEMVSVPPFAIKAVPVEKTIFRSCYLVTAALIPDSKKEYKGPVWSQGGVAYGEGGEAFEFTLDRITGDLCVPLTHFPIETIWVNEEEPIKQAQLDWCKKLRRQFLLALRDHLKSIPEDPKPSVAAPVMLALGEELGALQEAVAANVEEALSTGDPADVQEDTAEAVGEVLEREFRLKKPKKKKNPDRNLTIKDCRGLKKTEVLSLLKSLKVTWTVDGTSHYQFTAPNGSTITIPLKDSENADPNILRDALNQWGLQAAWRKALRRQ